ncbi:MAG: DUF2931 family protein [Chitinispirillia bacterium]
MVKTFFYIKIISVLLVLLISLFFIYKKEYYNIPLIILLIIALIITLYLGIRNMNRFDWLATECAHERFPMQIVRGDFIFKNGSSFYIPDGYESYRGWGEEGTTHVAGETFKPIPAKLYIHWFSFIEDKFYEGTFDLPYDKILKLFREGIEDPDGNGRNNYRRIMVGLAPEGEISVFLSGIGATVEVVNNLRAKEVQTDWKKLTTNRRDRYIRMFLCGILNDTENMLSEEKEKMLDEAMDDKKVDKVIKEGIPKGLMDSYRQQYPWKPIMTNCKPDYMLIRTFNGEFECYNFINPINTRINRGIPKKLEASWWDLKGTEYYAEILLNEEKTITDFENFFKDVTDEETEIEFVFVEKPRTLNRSKVLRTLDIYLKNSESQVKLEIDSIELE